MTENVFLDEILILIILYQRSDFSGNEHLKH